MDDPELKAMGLIADAMRLLEGDDAIARVLEWATKRYRKEPSKTVGPTLAANLVTDRTGVSLSTRTGEAAHVADLEEIVELRDGETVHVIARDIKAMSRNDAAVRLAHLVIYAYEVLTGQKEISSKNRIVPILKEWRAYDPNTRVALSRHPGIKRNGDLLSLDVHSRRKAETYIAEILDESIHGEWSPHGSRKRKRTNSVQNGRN